MHPAVSLIAHHALKYLHLAVPLLFAVLATTAHVHRPVQHSLLVQSASWALIWIPSIFRAGLGLTKGSRERKIKCWVAGALLALSAVCERAACDKLGVWSTKGLLPLLVVLIEDHGLLPAQATLPSYSVDEPAADGSPGLDKRTTAKSLWLVTVATISATVVLATRHNTTPTSLLGISSVIFSAAGLILFEQALHCSKDDALAGGRGFMSAKGTYSRRHSLEAAQPEHHVATLRDVALVMALACGIAAYLVEPAVAPDAISWEPVYRELQGDWKTLHYRRTVTQCLLMVVVDALVNGCLFSMLSQHGAANISFLLLFSFLCARLQFAASFSGVWFTVMFGCVGILFMRQSSSSASMSDAGSSIRFRRVVLGVTVLSLGFLSFRYASDVRRYIPGIVEPSSFQVSAPETPFAPIPMDLKQGHPAQQLTAAAEVDFEGMLSRQSKSLDEAVKEYRRRNGVPPPPHFDKWYEFATRNNVQLIDEFDSINQMLLPFWAVKPSTIRARVKLALGFEENSLIGMMIRNGEVVKIENGPEWQQQATVGMMKEFIQYLPDMDLAFNLHDEPRVVLPNDQLSCLVDIARSQSVPAAMKNPSPRNSFSPRPTDLNDGKRFEEAKTTRFNRFAHQQTWIHGRLSCSPTSQARQFEDGAPDNLTSYAVAPFNFVYNETAFADICNSPSLSYTFGFFEAPNAFNIIHELTPIFSQSKISSFQDILYPSPWYWFGKVGYDADRDTAWENKTNSLYWRGSTTGGYSRHGGWRRQHRQHIVRRLNALDKVKILVNDGTDDAPSYTVKEVDRKDYKPLVDIKFSHVGQCDEGDCDAQKEFFEVVERVDGQDAWSFKHLLDMDGNAFSGRFYSFLQSHSLTYKMAIFREWHAEWLKPWVHYVPLSLIGDEHLDLVRWFAGHSRRKEGAVGDADAAVGMWHPGNGDSAGEVKARQIAQRSTLWAGKVLRNVDFEAWFFRLLLEYARVIDDAREEIGFPGP